MGVGSVKNVILIRKIQREKLKTEFYVDQKCGNLVWGSDDRSVSATFKTNPLQERNSNSIAVTLFIFLSNLWSRGTRKCCHFKFEFIVLF